MGMRLEESEISNEQTEVIRLLVLPLLDKLCAIDDDGWHFAENTIFFEAWWVNDGIWGVGELKISFPWKGPVMSISE